jgi:hypothetical protein
MSGIGYFVVSTWQALVVDAKFADKHVWHWLFCSFQLAGDDVWCYIVWQACLTLANL